MKNYELIEEKYINEVSSECRVYKHIKTGAKVLTLKNNDNNKAFGIGFRTPPKTGNGVCHIVEHCVLSGSRKYKTKEPFMDLIKSSQQTFLNAMTFPDKTIYPISSRNKKDFYNLMDVYLDAVFYPEIHNEIKIFEQEGWHYELKNREDELKYNGVVYNEMKGVYSSAENIVADAITFNLHENSSYGVDSGGDPSLIPTLSYEEFKDYHKKYYHPTNSYIYLYGDLDMDEALSYIDDNYLNDFQKIDIGSNIILNDEYDTDKDVEITFSASKEEVTDNPDFLAHGWTIGYQTSKLDIFMRDLLTYILIESEPAPLKRAILDAGIGEDVYTETSTSLPLDLSIVVKNTKANKKEEFLNIIDSTLKNLVKEGIDRDLLEATLNRFEFIFREGGGSQKAIIYYIRALNSWLYDKSPLDSLYYIDVLNLVKSKLDDNFVEKYIEEKLINNHYSVTLVAKPEVDKNDKQDLKVKKELQKIKESLSEEEIEKLIEETIALEEYQMTEDSPEAKNTIPTLELSDIDKEITEYKVIHDKIGDIKYLKSIEDTNKIIYTNISHDIGFIEEDEIEKMSLMVSLLPLLDTKNYSYKELNNEIYKNTGGIYFAPAIYVDSKDNSKYYVRLNIKMKSLANNIQRGLELINEITENTILNSKARIKELLFIMKSRIEASMLSGGHQMVISIVKSYFSESSLYQSHIGGMKYYEFLKNLVENFDENFDDLLNSFENIYRKLFNKNNLIISATGSEEDLDNIKYNFEDYVENLADEKLPKGKFEFKEENKNEGYYITSNVVYVSKGYDLNKLGQKYVGDLTVLANILNSTFLHNEIRAKGGAYGGGITIPRTATLATYSYRDPNLENTVKVYDKIGEYVRNLDISTEDLKNFVIGSMNTFDPLLSPEDIGELNLSRFISNLSHEDVIKSKEEALNTNVEKLRAFGEVIEKAMNKNYLAVVGSASKIKENEELFKEIKSIK